MSYLTNPYRYAVSTYPDSLGSDADSTSVDATLNTADQILGTGCFSFNGTDNFCTLPNDLDTILSGGFTFSCWAYSAQADTEGDILTIINKPAHATWISPYDSFTLKQYGTNFQFTTNDTSTYVILSNAVGGIGWHNILVTKTAGNAFSFYVDDDTPITATHASTWGTQDWYIGDTPPADGNRHWNSLIDDMVFLSRVLSSAEITSLYNSGSGNLASTLDHTDIIAYYTFDDILLPNSAIPIE